MPHAVSRGIRIYWEHEGRGEPLLLIMGTGYTLEAWHRVRPVFARARRVVVFDNRGVGRSDLPSERYSIADMAADAAAVLDAAGVESADVVGAWLGGAVAQELALAHPERVRRLVLVGTSAFPHAVDPEPAALAMVKSRAHVDKHEGARAAVPFTYHPDTPAERVEEDLVIRLRTYPAKQGYAGQLDAAAAYRSRDRLGALTAPTLVVHGENDRLVPPGNGVDLASLIPDARLVLLPGASHNVFTDQPTLTVDTVLAFLDGRTDG